MSLAFAWEKLYLAVGTLCGQGSQHERLANAATLYLVRLRPDDLPADLRREFMQLMGDLGAVGAHWETANIEATVSRLDASVREQVIRKIVHIFSSVSRHLGA